MNEIVLNVACAVIISESKILIVRKGPLMKMAGKYEFPGGKIENNESEEDCIKREIKEELGIKVVVLKRLIPTFYKYESSSVHLIPFLCSQTDGQITLTEHDVFHWVDPHLLKDYDWCDADIAICEQVMNLDLALWR